MTKISFLSVLGAVRIYCLCEVAAYLRNDENSSPRESNVCLPEEGGQNEFRQKLVTEKKK